MKNVIFILSLFNVLYAQQEITQFTGSLKDGLIGYWPFSGNANDATGNGNNGSIKGATLTTDRFGNSDNAYYFDGIDDRIEILTNINHHIYGPQAKATLSVWILKSNNTTPGDILSKGYHSSKDEFGNKYLGLGFEPNSGKYIFNLYDATSMTSIQSPPIATINQWVHIVIVRDINVKMYINGVTVGINSVNAGWSVDYNKILDNLPMNFGARNNLSESRNPFWSNFWNGKLDDIAIWNRALTTEEIKSIYEFDSSINTKLIQTSKDEYQGNKFSLNSKNQQDSLTRLIPTQSQKSVFKLVKAISEADSQKRLKLSIDNLYNYFFLVEFNQNQTIEFVREIQYFVNLAKTDNNFYKYFESEITNFVDSANNYLNNRILRDFKSSIPQVESYSELWMNLLEIECYPWVKIDKYQENFISLVQQPVVNIYFQRLQTVENIKAQNELIVDFKTHFPKMNEDIDVIAFIFFRIDHEQCSGKFKLFNYNFFEHWVVGERDPLQNIPWWLARNENDEKEIASIYTNLYDSVSLWDFSLCRGTLCELTEVYVNNQLYFQMEFEGSDYAYFFDRNYPNLVRVYENSAKTKEVHFNGSERYSIYFKNGINITEKDIIDTLELATNLTKLPVPEFEKALALVSSLEWHSLPDSLDLKKQIDLKKDEIESQFIAWKIDLMNMFILEAQILIDNNYFEKSRDKLKSALKFCSEGTKTYTEIIQYLEEIDRKEKLYLEGLN